MSNVLLCLVLLQALLGSITFAIEIVYILDSSDTVTLDQYKDEKAFVLYLNRYLKMVPSHSRNAVISYGSSATVVSDLGQADTIQAFDLAVNNASKIGGQRRMDRAIDTARTVLSNARAAIPKVVILLTTGGQPTGINASVLESSMQRLYDLGARLYAVTINALTVILPLKNTDGSDWFPVSSFMDLPIQVLPLARHIASDTAAIGPLDFVADVIFMLDSSSHVMTEEFLKQKEFVKLIARYLNITPGKSRGAVIVYSTEATAILSFGGYTTMSEFNAVIDRATPLSGRRSIDRAFDLANTLFKNARSNVRKVAILLTSGRQSPDGGSLLPVMQALRDNDVMIYVTAVGSESDVPVQKPGAMFLVRSYNDLSQQLQSIARNMTAQKDPCQTDGCRNPYNIGCRVVNNRAQCICPSCGKIRSPICASDGVQDLNECLMRQQACKGNFNVTVAKQGQCDKECRSVVDIAFVIDSSGSIGSRNWERIKRYLKSVVSKFEIGSSAARMAIIVYSTNPQVALLFRNFQSTDMVNKVLDDMRWKRGLTFTDKALLLAASSVFLASNGMRSNVTKVAVVITDGKQTTTRNYTNLSFASQGIKDKGVVVYAVGIGKRADRTELEQIVSGTENVLISSSFKELQNISTVLTQKLCQEATRGTKATTPTQTVTPTPTPTPTPTSPDPCKTEGCRAPYNAGCTVVSNKAHCICPICRNFREPVCASDGVQDLTECHLKRQACQANLSITVRKKGPCDNVCSLGLDVAFIIDSSGSIGGNNWIRMKRFVKSVVSKLDVGPSSTRIAAIAYSTNPKVVWRFNDYQAKDMVNRVLDNMAWQRGFTYTDRALLLATNDLFQLFNGTRINVTKFAVVITDGKQTKNKNYTELSLASRGLKDKGVVVYTVGVGKGVSGTELEEIASGTQFVLRTLSFEKLPTIADEVVKRLCEDPCRMGGCNAPYNTGCQVKGNKAECICPTCRLTRRPVCASDGVQDLSECHLRQQACLADINVTIAKQGRCDKECRSVVDIAFVIDSSGRIGRENWERMKRFVKAFVSKFDVGFSTAHVAAIAYSTYPEITLMFRDYQGRDEVNRRLDRMRRQRGYTYTDKALLLTNSQLFQTSNGMRQGVKKLAVVITDGRQTKTGNYTRLSVASQGIKNKGVIVYAVGVGSGVYKAELEEIASTPDKVFISSTFEDLQKISSELTRRMCEDLTSTTSLIETTTSPEETTTSPQTTPEVTEGGRTISTEPKPRTTTTPEPATSVLTTTLRVTESTSTQATTATPTPTTTDPKGNHSTDVLFILDSSSFSTSSYNTSKELVKSLARYLDFQPQETRAALVVSNTRTTPMSDFESFSTVSDFTYIVDGTPHLGGDRSLSEALRTAATMFPKSSSVSKVIFLVTSGKPLINEDGSIIGHIVDRLGTLGVRVYFALIDPESKLEGFRDINESSANVFAIESRGDISQQIYAVGSQLITDSATPKKQNLTMYILFVLDSSEEVSRFNFTQQKEFVKSFISRLNIYPADSSTSRVGIMVYSEEASMVLDFQTKPNKSGLEAVVDNISRLQGSRRIDKALKAATDAFEDIDTNDPKFVILFAAGQQTNDARAEGFSAAVRPLHRTGAKTHILAIGDKVDPAYFQQEDEERANVVPIASFSDLPQGANQLAEGLLQDYVYPKEPIRPTGTTASTERTPTKSFVSPSPRVSISPSDKGSSTESDMVFLVDTSKGVTQTDLSLQREFVKFLGQQLGVAPGKSHAAVLSYSDRPRLIGGFYAHLRGKRFEEVVDSVTQTGGKRNIEEALKQAKRMLNMARPTVPYVVFLIAYGKQATDFNPSRLRDAAQGILDMGARLYVIGVGVDGSDAQFQTLVTRPADFFQIPSSKDFRSHVLAITYNIGFETRVPENFKVKVVYVLDSTTFVGAENFELEKDFTKALARRLNHNPNMTQSAVIIFDSFPDISIRMGSFKDIKRFSEAVDNLRYFGGHSQLHFALPFAGRAFSKDDPTVPQIIIIITNKDPTNSNSIDTLAGNLRREGKIIHVIGVGNETSFPNLRRLVTRSENMFTPESFGDLMSYVPKVASSIIAMTQPTPVPSLLSSTTLSSTAKVTAKATLSVKDTSTTTKLSTPITTKGTSSPTKATSTLFPASTTKSPSKTSGNGCPSYSPYRQCPGSVQDECSCHADCDVANNYMCCFDGCRRLCRLTNARTLCVQGVDIVFLMDSSESITEEDFQREKTAVKEIAQSFLNSSQDSRAGVIMYSGQPELSVDFVGRSEFEYFKSAVDRLAHRRSMTRIDRAIYFASRTLFENPRTAVMSVAVVMTDGVQTPEPDAEPLSQAVSALNSKGVRVLAVGVGPRVNRSELKELVTSQEDVFQMSSFQELLDKSEKLLETVCPATRTETSESLVTRTRHPTTRSPPTSPISTTTATIVLPACDKLFDVIFVMDSSQSINAPQYNKEKEFVKMLAKVVNVGNGSRASVIIYSDKAQLKIRFGQHENLDSFKEEVDSLPYLQQRTRIDKALTMAAQVLKLARPNIPKAVIVMTDGRQTQEPDAMALNVAADAIHRQGARLLVVGVGPKLSMIGLRLIAKYPSNIFTVQSFENLASTMQDVVKSACGDLPTPSYCPPLTGPPLGVCASRNSTCFGDESCSSNSKCCFDGCRFSCVGRDGDSTTGTTPTTPPLGPQCNKAFDLGFAMDSSGSIRDANYQKQKDFIREFSRRLDLRSKAVQLGLIVFSDVPFLSVRFGTLKSTDRLSFAAAVDAVPYFRGRTRIDSALDTAAKYLFPEGRQNLVPQIFFLITDGRQSQDAGAVPLDQAVRPLQQKAIKVVVIGVGDDVDKDELRSLVVNPSEDVFFVPSFDDLKPLLDNAKLKGTLCIPKRRRL